MKKIRHHQHAVRTVQKLFSVLGQIQKLKYRIDFHKLRAGDLVKTIRIQQSKALLQHAVHPSVPVVHRIFQKISLRIQQAEVHPPGVHADAVRLPVFF